MSTTYVGREIMNRLGKRFPDFSYKRASGNPTNPINQADALELEKIKWFNNHPDQTEWHGLILRDNRSYYARYRAIRAETECLRCHGDPKDAPQQMKEIYGVQGGYHYRVGEIVAADSIYIPVDVTFLRVKETAWNVFLIATISLFALLGLFYLLFNRTVITQMNELLKRFREIDIRQDGVPPLEPTVETSDEFEQLRNTFENVAIDLKHTHEELRASESKYRKLFESSRDTIIICDRENRLIDINQAGGDLFGFKDQPEALSIETYYQLFWDTRDAVNFTKTLRQKGYVEEMEVPLVDRRGQKLAVMISATKSVDETGRFDGFDARLQDVTTRRKMEMHLAQTEKLVSIGQLASGVAHEINNPLGVIQIYANLISKSNPQDAQVDADIRIIQKHTEQCKSIVQALLNFARVSEPLKAKCDIHECLADVLKVLEPQMNKKAIELETEIDRDLPNLLLDETQMKQVFMNLIINALQSMDNRGKITISLRRDVIEKHIEIKIADTGAGIAEKYLNRIFDPFFTTKGPGKGTGLGLAVSYGIVKRHGGEISVDSIPGQGSSFTIHLPIEESKQEN
jgi:PAS domain S-box-containing protein